MDLARQRMLQQHLVGARCARPEDVVEGLLAVQSQDFHGATWAVAQRTVAVDAAEVLRAFQDGRILRTHVLRPTWHFVAPGDLRWLLALTAPRIHAAKAARYRAHGLDAAEIRRTRARIVKALAGGRHLQRDELARALADGRTPMRGVQLAHVLMRAELDGVICSGAMRGKQHTFALVDERAAPAPALERDEALATLARRYVAGHGPAQTQDLAWWSGLTVADARRGLEASGGALAREVIDGKTFWLAPSAPAPRRDGPVVDLLSNYDELVVAFRDRSAMVDPRIELDADMVFAHSVVVDGRIVGDWRRSVGAREIAIAARLLRPLTAVERRRLEAAAARYARAFGLEARLEVEQVA